MIDTSDIRELTPLDFAKGRKNPYAKKLRKNGYSIVINVSPEDIANMTQSNVEAIQGMDMLKLDPEEQRAMKMYMEANRV